MRKVYNLFFIVVVFMFSMCTYNDEREKHYDHGDNVVDVHERVKEMEIREDDVMIGSVSRLFILDKYLIIADYKSQDMLICMLDKSNFEHVINAVPKGQGPGEITNMGYIGTNESKREFYISDHGKQKIFRYKPDSLFNNPSYIPDVKKEINNTRFPDEYVFINDTLSFARIIVLTGNSGYNEFTAKWNMQTGEMTPMPYTHPEIKKKRMTLAVSIENGKYVECYHNYDLMTVSDLNGNLIYNVYGSLWKNGEEDRRYYFGDVVFCRDKIVASFSGGERNSENYLPTRFIVFDLDGTYLKTLETGYRISHFCYDKDHNRIIMSLDDVIQFAYLDLDGLSD